MTVEKYQKSRYGVRLLLTLLVAVFVAILSLLYATLRTSRSSVANDDTPLSAVHATDADAIRRGKYVMRLGDCVACHTAGKGELAGGYAIPTGFGTLLSSNITPEPHTGIGNMTERQFFNAVRQGIGRHGFLYPAMPYTAYAKLSDSDMHDLWSYMSTVKPVSNRVRENAGLRFPYDLRPMMAGWDLLFFQNKGLSPDPAQSVEWNRGKYLVDGAAHCSACHSPRNALGAEISSSYLHGAIVDHWYAPDLTSNKTAGVGSTSNEAISRYLRTGSDGRSVAAGPMAEAVENSFQYLTPTDADAIATYIKSVPSSNGTLPPGAVLDSQQIRRATLDYIATCSACHGVNGEGIKSVVPAFAGNPSMVGNPTSMIRVMLTGARAPFTSSEQTAAGMPAFAWKYDDQRIADLLTYLRTSWGNKGGAIPVADVAELRKQLNAHPPLRNPAP